MITKLATPNFVLCVVRNSLFKSLKFFPNGSIDEKHPDGWPRLAAFMESSDSFGIYRKFGHCHARLLAIHMSNITEMETELFDMDSSDELGGKATDWRLKNRYHRNGLDTTKRDLQERLEKELLTYGTDIPLSLSSEELKSKINCS